METRGCRVWQWVSGVFGGKGDGEAEATDVEIRRALELRDCGDFAVDLGLIRARSATKGGLHNYQGNKFIARNRFKSSLDIVQTNCLDRMNTAMSGSMLALLRGVPAHEIARKRTSGHTSQTNHAGTRTDISIQTDRYSG